MNVLKSYFWKGIIFGVFAVIACAANTAQAADFTTAIAGRVFCDDNCNGQIDIGVDQQMLNVTVQLFNGAGQLIATTTPAAFNGTYIFPDLVVGQTYTVKVVPAIGQSVINAFPAQNAVKLSTKSIRAVVVQSDVTYYPNDFLLKCCAVSFTQCSWGYDGCGFNPIDLIKTNFCNLFPDGVTIGGNKTLTFTSPSAILRFLPASGTPRALLQTRINPYYNQESRFAGNVLALTLNVKISQAGITGEDFLDKEVATGLLAGWSVTEILDLANQVLGGDSSGLPAGVTLSYLNTVLDNLNENNCCAWNTSGCFSFNDNGYCRRRSRCR